LVIFEFSLDLKFIGIYTGFFLENFAENLLVYGDLLIKS